MCTILNFVSWSTSDKVCRVISMFSSVSQSPKMYGSRSWNRGAINTVKKLVPHRPLSRRTLPPRPDETDSRHRRRRTKCGAPPSQPHFLSAAAAEHFVARRNFNLINHVFILSKSVTNHVNKPNRPALKFNCLYISSKQCYRCAYIL